VRSLPKEIFLPPGRGQLDELLCHHDLEDLLRADVVREMGAWGKMFVLRPKEVKRSPSRKRIDRRPPQEGRWGSSS
jgi:hypothetical protein